MAAHPLVPPPGAVTVYATSWCPYCSLLRRSLEDEGVPFELVDVEQSPDASAAAAAVEKINGGNRVVPTVVFPDGTTATNPGLDDVLLRIAR
ncbi:glutaredoxin domain-containing protein [Mobilicoccus massiliensis]|uniref:glutaredoxin domain-containing protein n=1 Tax=Mobilicoccus massiliensis TaxID=1522310 RepID=UPI0006950B5F|nr:glutaredoxin domain-containing protein [Mobilicoccus massiliensis]